MGESSDLKPQSKSATEEELAEVDDCWKLRAGFSIIVVIFERDTNAISTRELHHHTTSLEKTNPYPTIPFFLSRNLLASSIVWRPALLVHTLDRVCRLSERIGVASSYFLVVGYFALGEDAEGLVRGVLVYGPRRKEGESIIMAKGKEADTPQTEDEDGY